MKATSPKGVPINGILEAIKATAFVDADSFSRKADGTLDFEYDGAGSRIDWDSQVPVRVENQLLFVDDNGNIWNERDLVLVEEAEQPKEIPTA